MVEFEESAELNRQEIQEHEKELGEFEVQMEDGRNEGLFFKNLRRRTPVDKSKAKEEAEKMKDVAREKAGSRTRKGFYLLFIGLLTFAIVDSIASSSTVCCFWGCCCCCHCYWIGGGTYGLLGPTAF